MIQNYSEIFHKLFKRAAEANSFGVICTILRVGGMQDANWDTFEESREALEDYNWILEKTALERNGKANMRIALLMYCQLIEMTAPHEMITNFLRIIKGEEYYICPLQHLGRSSKKGLSYTPPSAKTKLNYIKELANEIGGIELIKAIDTIYSDKIRNAFSHSDYIITESGFRFTEGRFPEEIPMKDMHAIINECFDFYSAFIGLHKEWLIEFSKINRFHKWPNYEVLELLSNKEGLYGFNVHFSNGSKSTYQRNEEGSKAINIFFEADGINYMVGDLDELEKKWKVNGIVVDDWNKLECSKD